MTVVDYRSLAEQLLPLCLRVGAAIAEIYHRDVKPDVTLKADDTPVTAADRLAHRMLLEGLEQLTPGWPVLSEEAPLPPFAERRQWSRYWLIDPLDGTREFISRSGEFVVSIALIERGVAVLGLIGVPLRDVVYVGVPGAGAFRADSDSSRVPLQASTTVPGRLRVLCSKRRRSRAFEECLQKLQSGFAGVEEMRAGSALKFCLLAEGAADLYPQFSPCSEWDTAAGQALLEAAGGKVLSTAFAPLRYNTRASVESAHFYATSAAALDWSTCLS